MPHQAHFSALWYEVAKKKWVFQGPYLHTESAEAFGISEAYRSLPDDKRAAATADVSAFFCLQLAAAALITLRHVSSGLVGGLSEKYFLTNV